MTSAANLLKLLAERYPPKGWAFLPEFRNTTGRDGERYADAIAVSLFPSRGLEIWGFEIKVSKSDLKSELSDPVKADAVGRFCTCWYLVIPDETLIEGLDIPPAWGILKPKGTALHLVRKAERRKPDPPDIGLVCSMARRMSGEHWVAKREVDQVVEKRVTERVAEEREWIHSTRSYALDQAQKEAESLRKTIATFEAASGVRIDTWDAGNIGEAVKAHREGIQIRNYALSTLDMLVSHIDNDLKRLKAVQKQHEPKETTA